VTYNTVCTYESGAASTRRRTTGLRTEGGVDEIDSVLRRTRPVAADRAAGQALLDAKPAVLQSYLELGRWKMQHLDDVDAHKEREDALRAEGSF
jgi:hypothetical protein